MDDIEDDWDFGGSFDFVFARFLTGSIKDWPRFFKQSYEYRYADQRPSFGSVNKRLTLKRRTLNSGGYIEVQDAIYPLHCDDNSLSADAAAYRWSLLLKEGFARNGRPLDSALHYQSQLAEAGFVDIKVEKERWPTGKWAKDKKYKQLGIWNGENIVAGLSGVSLATFTRPEEENGLGWSNVELEVLLASVRRDFKDNSIHAYFPM